MDFELTGEQKELQSTARRIVDERIYPLLASTPEQPLPKETVIEIFQLLKPLGYLGARTPSRLGGDEVGYVTYGMLMEQLPPVIAVDVIAQETTATRIALSGTEEQHERFLQPILNGEKIAGTATSEPGVGSNPREVQCRARPDGVAHYRINGEKIWVTNGSICDILMTVVSLGEKDGKNVIGRILLDREESPFEARELDVLGLKHGHLSQVWFDDCRVPAANSIGQTGDFHRYLTFTWLANRPIFGLMGAHIAQRALDAAVAYAKQREQFGKPIAAFQLVQDMLVEIATLADTSRLLAYRALSLLDRGEWAHKESSMAKFYGTEAAVKASSLALQVHGSFGLTKEYGIEKMYRDARMLPLPDGTTQIQRLIVGRELTGIRAYA